MHSMFETFSRGYYLGRLYVEPHDGEYAVMRRDQHERVNEQLYATGEGIERLDHPLVMKVGTRHFAVHGESGLPENTLLLPRARLADETVDPLPTTREVLLAKADRAGQLLNIFSEPQAGR